MPFVFNMVGTAFIGCRDKDPDGSYVTTEWFMLFLPIFPLRSFRVWRTGDDKVKMFYQSIGYRAVRVPLSRRQVLNLYAAVFGIPIAAFLVVLLISMAIEHSY